jgi:hypothetical protein
MIEILSKSHHNGTISIELVVDGKTDFSRQSSSAMEVKREKQTAYLSVGLSKSLFLFFTVLSLVKVSRAEINDSATIARFFFHQQPALKSWELFRPTNKAQLGFIRFPSVTRPKGRSPGIDDIEPSLSRQLSRLCLPAARPRWRWLRARNVCRGLAPAPQRKAKAR